MVTFKAVLQKYGKMGEKTGWTYLEVPQALALKLMPGNKRSFRVKGTIDEYDIKAVSLLPVGEGNFIMPVNLAMRKAICKRSGDSVKLKLVVDETTPKISPALLMCLRDEPSAKIYFDKLPPSHQQYYSKWIENAKTEATRIKRIGLAITAFSQKLSYPELMKLQKSSGYSSDSI